MYSDSEKSHDQFVQQDQSDEASTLRNISTKSYAEGKYTSAYNQASSSDPIESGPPMIQLAYAEGGATDTSLKNPQQADFGGLCDNIKKVKVQPGPKDGSYFVRGPVSGSGTRADENIARADVIILDGDSSITGDGITEKGAPHPMLVHQVLASADIPHAIYTSHSHTPESPRYRVIVPCQLESKHQLEASVEWLLELLHRESVPLAPVPENLAWSQAWYYPRLSSEGAEYLTYTHDTDERLDVTKIVDWYEERHALPEAMPTSTVQTDTPWNQYNAEHGTPEAMGAFLEAHGYLAGGTAKVNGTESFRFLHPESETGSPGVRLFKGESGKWLVSSSHGGDVLNNGHAHDAFSLFTVLNKGGDTKAAVEAVEVPPAEDGWPELLPLPDLGRGGSAPPFPDERLPLAIRRASAESSRFNKVPPASTSLIGLSTAATAIGKRAVVEERPGLEHHPALFFVGIAESGERKGSAFKTMTAPLDEWAEEKKEAWENETLRAKAKNKAIAQKVGRALKNSNSSVEATAQEVYELERQKAKLPPFPRLSTTNTTEERAFQLMDENFGAFAVMSGEGRPAIDAIIGRYSGARMTGDAVYLAGVSGDAISRDRVGSAETGPEIRHISHPCLNVCILVQQDKYMEFASHKSLRQSGAVARVWPVWLESLVGSRHEQQGEQGLLADVMLPYKTTVRRLLEYSQAFDPEKDPPHKAVLGPEATELRRLYFNQVETMEAPGGPLEDCRDIASKAVTQTCKLALVLHLAGSPQCLAEPTSIISGKTWNDAQVLGAWFLNEAVRVQRSADEDPILAGTWRVLDWVRRERKESVTAREVQQSCPRPRPNAEQAGKMLDLLEDHGYVRSTQVQGRRKPVYAVNPKVATVATVSG